MEQSKTFYHSAPDAESIINEILNQVQDDNTLFYD